MPLTGTNPEHARSFNRRVVIEAVRLHAPISRAEIARMTGLSAQTISTIADELLSADLLLEARRHNGGRGQPPLALALNPQGGFTLGLSLDRGRLVAVLVDLAGALRATSDIALTDHSPDAVLPLIEATAVQLAGQAGAARDRIIGAGLVLPTLLDEGSPVSFGPTTIPAWEGLPIAAMLSERLDMPVLIENDATAAAIGEQLYGVGKGLRDFIYVYFGIGLGSGLVIAGQPYRGFSGKAGELGHVIVDPGGRPCPCGNRGCLERYVSMAAALEAMGGKGLHAAAIDRGALIRALAESEPKLLDWLDQAARHLRTAIAMLENLLEPQAIIVGGILPEPLLDALLARLHPLLPSVSARSHRAVPRLLKAEIGLETPALGAAALPLFDSLAPRFSLLLQERRRPAASLPASDAEPIG